MGGAVAALPEAGARVFLAIGKQNVAEFAAKPGNFYLLRLVDPPRGALPLPTPRPSSRAGRSTSAATGR